MEDWSKNIAFGTPEQPVDDTPVMLRPFTNRGSVRQASQ
jgi:hypothetical protein